MTATEWNTGHRKKENPMPLKKPQGARYLKPVRMPGEIRAILVREGLKVLPEPGVPHAVKLRTTPLFAERCGTIYWKGGETLSSLRVQSLLQYPLESLPLAIASFPKRYALDDHMTMALLNARLECGL